MKKQRIILALLLITLFMTSSVSATKIQKDDEWVYKDQNEKLYDEKALEVVQLINTTGEPIASVLIETNRSFVYPIIDFKDVYFEAEMIYDGIYLTQEGGIPYITRNMSLNGFVYKNNVSYDLSLADVSWVYVGSPALSLTTTVSSRYSVQLLIIWNSSLGLEYSNNYIISSNNNIEDSKKNFTISPTFHEIIFQDVHEIVYIEGLSLSSFESTMELRYEEGINQPIYVGQTEPVKTDGLALSSDEVFMEYFLVMESTEKETPLNLSLIFLSFVAIIIIKKNSK